MLILICCRSSSWSAEKQPTIARSSTETEYRVLASVTVELTWITMLLHELKIPVKLTPVIWCDNLSATSLASNPVFHARTKHIELDYHFIREKVLQKLVFVHHVLSMDQYADIFTKPLSSFRFKIFRSKLKVLPSLNFKEAVNNNS